MTMQSHERKIDAAMQSYAERWMKSIDRPRASTTLGYFFVGMFILFWSSSLTALLGFDLKKGYGALIFIIVGLSLTFTTIFINRLMTKLGLDRSIRSALWLSAVIGPYANLISYNYWHLPVISHIVGFAASILAFIFSFLLDKMLGKYMKPGD
ncbi:MAG: hypothetical protein A2Y53_02930 [Chloroflexi bacterium RBG_16_47_49]|nr:MAG: hypothetical protein A2Y53_02930 [Chloroflexi bacterium RBG_16_47_49]